MSRVAGRIVVVGLLGGAETELDLGLLMRKRAQIRPARCSRSRPLEEKIAAARALERHIAPLLAAGSVRPVLDRVLPLAQASEAHRVVQRSETFGKVVLEVE